MLEIKNLSVSYQKKTILQDVSFSLRPNRITVLLGRNGCGKSTLVNCINRLLPYRGTILLDGKDIQSLPKTEIAKRIAIFPQILPATDLSVHALCALGRTPYTGMLGLLSEVDLQAIEQALQTTKTDRFRNRACSSLSGGERQMAFLSMLLAQQTPLLVMDEPVTYLDADAAKHFYSIISTLVRTQNKTALLILHDLNDAVSIADDIVILDSNTVIFAGSTSDCLSANAIEATFHVRRFSTSDQTFHWFA